MEEKLVLVRIELTNLHLPAMHAVMALSGLHLIVR